MKASLFLVSTLVLAASSTLFAQEAAVEPPVPVQAAPAPVVTVPAAVAPASPVFEYDQHLYGQNRPTMIPADKANEIVQSFRATYEKLGKPRVLFYINRDLIDANSGLKVSSRHETTQATVTSAASAPGQATTEPYRSSTVSGENNYTSTEQAAPTLTDRLTAREIERLFGRPFRAAGATIADQKVASALIADQPLDHFTAATNDTARKDREALQKVADLVVEILISSRTVNESSFSGNHAVTVPDIQVTAIRLSDSAVLGQSSSADVLGQGRSAAQVAQQFDVRDITEATALALMEDISGHNAK